MPNQIAFQEHINQGYGKNSRMRQARTTASTSAAASTRVRPGPHCPMSLLCRRAGIAALRGEDDGDGHWSDFSPMPRLCNNSEGRAVNRRAVTGKLGWVSFNVILLQVTAALALLGIATTLVPPPLGPMTLMTPPPLPSPL